MRSPLYFLKIQSQGCSGNPRPGEIHQGAYSH